MEILKTGKEKMPWTKKATCTGKGNGQKGCGAKLLISAGDLYTTFKSDDGETNTSYYTFQCPCCKVETDIGVYGSVPYEVQVKINKHEKSKYNSEHM